MKFEEIVARLGILALLSWFLVSNFRFLLQGRWYRKLDQTQKETNPDAEELHAYHGDELPLPRLILFICFAIAAIAFAARRQIWLLMR